MIQILPLKASQWQALMIKVEKWKNPRLAPSLVYYENGFGLTPRLWTYRGQHIDQRLEKATVYNMLDLVDIPCSYVGNCPGSLLHYITAGMFQQTPQEKISLWNEDISAAPMLYIYFGDSIVPCTFTVVRLFGEVNNSFKIFHSNYLLTSFLLVSCLKIFHLCPLGSNFIPLSMSRSKVWGSLGQEKVQSCGSVQATGNQVGRCLTLVSGLMSPMSAGRASRLNTRSRATGPSPAMFPRAHTACSATCM
ncbi:unnamed protein product [Timema podura]|uniref:Uncharacterized protein n=1 Tax=Timema podura TaxID=61482 RepID=A0ABN7NDX1_TIMPD|nr:unnamed protein product [Timema podura]